MTLRDVYLQMAVLGIGSMLCASGCPTSTQTHATAAESGREEDADEGFAVAASEM